MLNSSSNSISWPTQSCATVSAINDAAAALTPIASSDAAASTQFPAISA
jgi:hypothetical protein